MVDEAAWEAGGDKGMDGRRHVTTGWMMRRACGNNKDKEEAGKDGADKEEADDCGDDG